MSAKEIIFVLCSIIVLVCNMTFLQSSIDIIELICYLLLYIHVVVLVKSTFQLLYVLFTILIVCWAWDFCNVTFIFKY